MARSIPSAVQELCLALPDTEEVRSHGMPDFRVRGRTFATFVVNHHGDGRIALWLNAPPGAQQHHVEAEPRHFFVPPYVGPRGWLGVNLDRGIAWPAVVQLVCDAWANVAPRGSLAPRAKAMRVRAPTAKMKPAEIDPLQSPRARKVLARMRKLCLALPEASEGTQFGSPVWRAGSKVFAQAWCYRGDLRLKLGFRVGVDQQGLLVRERRFTIPPYMGHNGWIALDVTDSADWEEIASLTLQSYRHFALQRMLRVLDGEAQREPVNRTPRRRPRTT